MRPRGQIAGSKNVVRLVDSATTATIRPDRQHRYRRVPKDVLSDGAEDDLTQSAAAMSTDHDQVDLPLAGAVQQSFGYRPFQHAYMAMLVVAKIAHMAQAGFEVQQVASGGFHRGMYPFGPAENIFVS